MDFKLFGPQKSLKLSDANLLTFKSNLKMLAAE